MNEIPAPHQRLIDRLTARGHYATFRRWGEVDTVWVAGREFTPEGGRIRMFDRVAFLVPVDDGRWKIYIDLFDDAPVSEDDVIDRVARLLFDDAEYGREFARFRHALERKCREEGESRESNPRTS